MKQKGTIALSDTVLSVLFILIVGSMILMGSKLYFDMAKSQKANADTATIFAAIAQYEMELGKYPENLKVLTQSEGQYGPWLKELSTDVFTVNSSYQYLKDDENYIVFSVGPDGISSSSLVGGIGGDDIGYKDI